MKNEVFITCTSVTLLVCLTSLAIAIVTVSHQERVKRFESCMFYTGNVDVCNGAQ